MDRRDLSIDCRLDDERRGRYSLKFKKEKKEKINKLLNCFSFSLSF